MVIAGCVACADRFGLACAPLRLFLVGSVGPAACPVDRFGPVGSGGLRRRIVWGKS